MEVSTLLWVGVVLLPTVLFLRYNKRGKLPPGPAGLPFWGYYPFLGKDAVKTVTELGKKYGNVLGLYLGQQFVVILNDWEAMTEGYSQDSSLYRPGVFAKLPFGLGSGSANGPLWVQTRRLMSKAMKDIGLQRTVWEELIQEEVTEVVERITQHGPGPLEVRPFFSETFTNNILTLVLGERLHAGHPLTKQMTRAVDVILESTASLQLNNFSPRLHKILEVLGYAEETEVAEKLKDFVKYVSNTVDDKIGKPEKESEDSFIDHHNRDLKGLRDDQLYKHPREHILKGNVMALLTGGSETSRTTTIWALMAMADHPEKQRKVQQELDRELGRDGIITWAERSKIPYTYASLLEAMRFHTVVPISSLRMAADDMQVQGHLIPKGTFLSFNMWAVHNDPKYWKEPEKFVPERFLMDGGKKVNASPDSFCPFSYGKRNCPGKLLALMEILQIYTALLQKFTVVPSSGEKVKYDTILGLTLQATNVELCFLPRE